MKGASIRDLSRRFDEANLRAARDILRHPHLHGGELAFAVTWARAVVARLDNPSAGTRDGRVGQQHG